MASCVCLHSWLCVCVRWCRALFILYVCLHGNECGSGAQWISWCVWSVDVWASILISVVLGLWLHLCVYLWSVWFCMWGHSSDSTHTHTHQSAPCICLPFELVLMAQWVFAHMKDLPQPNRHNKAVGSNTQICLCLWIQWQTRDTQTATKRWDETGESLFFRVHWQVLCCRLGANYYFLTRRQEGKMSSSLHIPPQCLFNIAGVRQDQSWTYVPLISPYKWDISRCCVVFSVDSLAVNSSGTILEIPQVWNILSHSLTLFYHVWHRKYWFHWFYNESASSSMCQLQLLKFRGSYFSDQWPDSDCVDVMLKMHRSSKWPLFVF